MTIILNANQDVAMRECALISNLVIKSVIQTLIVKVKQCTVVALKDFVQKLKFVMGISNWEIRVPFHQNVYPYSVIRKP